MSRERRGLVVQVALGVVGLGLLAGVLYGNRGPIREVAARGPDLGRVGWAFAVYMAAVMVTYGRWYVLVHAVGLPFRPRDAVRLGFIGGLFNLVIPGGIGGDVVKGAYLCREQPRRALAIATMVIDRLVGLLALFLLASLAGAAAWGSAGVGIRRLIALAWLAAGTGTVGLAVIFSPPLYKPLLRWTAGRRKLHKVLDELASMAAAYRSRLGVVLGCLAVSVGIHVGYATAFDLMARALFPAASPTLPQNMLIFPLVMFTTAVPLPFGALGLTEGISGQLYGLVKFDGGAVAMMGYRVLMYAGGVIAALVYLANIRQVRDLRDLREASA